MPPFGQVERKNIEQIAKEFERLAQGLHQLPKGQTTSTRGPGPSRAILGSLRKVNATLAAASRGGSLRPAGFNVIAREFSKISASVKRAGAASKPTTRKATKRTAR